MVDERQNGVAVEQQALALTGVGHIGQLVGRNVQLLGENLSVTGSLIEHIDEVRVFKDVLDFPAAQKVFDILGDAGGDAAPFTETLPDFHGVAGGLFLFQQQMELVNVIPGGLPGRTVDGDAVPDLILDDQHTDLFQLLAQLLDVVADDAAAYIHIGVMVKHIQRAGDIDFQSRCDVLRFLFVLFPEGIVQVLQNGHILRLGVVQVVPVDQAHTTVNDGLFHGCKAVLAAHNQFAQGQDEVRFQGQRVILVAVIQIQVHGIDIAGRTVVALARGGQSDDLTVEGFNQGNVLSFGVADDDVIRGDKESIADLTLGREGLTGTGGAENQAVGVLQILAVNHDKVVGQGVDAVVQRFLSGLE